MSAEQLGHYKIQSLIARAARRTARTSRSLKPQTDLWILGLREIAKPPPADSEELVGTDQILRAVGYTESIGLRHAEHRRKKTLRSGTLFRNNGTETTVPQLAVEVAEKRFRGLPWCRLVTEAVRAHQNSFLEFPQGLARPTGPASVRSSVRIQQHGHQMRAVGFLPALARANLVLLYVDMCRHLSRPSLGHLFC